jgi:hypothetical protein
LAQEQAPPHAQPPPDTTGEDSPDPTAFKATRLISGMLARLSQLGQTAASSRSAMGRNTSNTERQSLQRYSYTGTWQE